MGRPPLALGTWGEISVQATRDPDGRIIGHRASARYRDLDGVTRVVSRRGRSASAARNSLRSALSERSRLSAAGELSGGDPFSKAADLWMVRLQRLASEGRRSPGTVQTYRGHLDHHVLPAIGSLRLREITTPLLDRFVGEVRDRVGTATARSCRSIVSGVMGLAVRHGAIASNPTRDIERVEGRPKKEPRALTSEERRQWFRSLREDETAVMWDIPDLSLFLMATGLRIGEVLAVLWSEVDLEEGTVEVTSTLIRIKGDGLLRKITKSKAGQRQLLLPIAATEMLRSRWLRGYRFDMPVFPNLDGGFRDPSNTRRELTRAAKRNGFAWVTSHNFRKTTATILDEAGVTARVIADQLGHSRPSMTQDVYLGRKAPGRQAVDALDRAFLGLEGLPEDA